MSEEAKSDDDVLLLSVKRERWANVESVVFDVDVGGGDFQIECYEVQTPLKDILAKRQEPK